MVPSIRTSYPALYEKLTTINTANPGLIRFVGLFRFLIAKNIIDLNTTDSKRLQTAFEKANVDSVTTYDQYSIKIIDELININIKVQGLGEQASTLTNAEKARARTNLQQLRLLKRVFEQKKFSVINALEPVDGLFATLLHAKNKDAKKPELVSLKQYIVPIYFSGNTNISSTINSLSLYYDIISPENIATSLGEPVPNTNIWLSTNPFDFLKPLFEPLPTPTPTPIPTPTPRQLTVFNRGQNFLKTMMHFGAPTELIIRNVIPFQLYQKIVSGTQIWTEVLVKGMIATAVGGITLSPGKGANTYAMLTVLSAGFMGLIAQTYTIETQMVNAGMELLNTAVSLGEQGSQNQHAWLQWATRGFLEVILPLLFGGGKALLFGTFSKLLKNGSPPTKGAAPATPPPTTGAAPATPPPTTGAAPATPPPATPALGGAACLNGGRRRYKKTKKAPKYKKRKMTRRRR